MVHTLTHTQVGTFSGNLTHHNEGSLIGQLKIV